MGIILSLVSKGITVADKIKKQKEDDRKREEEKKLNEFKKPITPPKYYKTLADRELHVDASSPYSVANMRTNINRDILPVGYSLEQLDEVGFKPEVDNWKTRRVNEEKELTEELVVTLSKVRKWIAKDFPESSQLVRDAINDLGLTEEKNKQELLETLDRFITDAKEGNLSVSSLDLMIKIMSEKTGIVTDSISNQESIHASREAVIAAGKQNSEDVLKVLNRALLS